MAFNTKLLCKEIDNVVEAQFSSSAIQRKFSGPESEIKAQRKAYKQWLKNLFYNDVDNHQNGNTITVDHMVLAAASGYKADHDAQVIGKIFLDNPHAHILHGVGVDPIKVAEKDKKRKEDKKQLDRPVKKSNEKHKKQRSTTQGSFPLQTPGGVTPEKGWRYGEGSEANEQEIADVLTDIHRISIRLNSEESKEYARNKIYIYATCGEII